MLRIREHLWAVLPEEGRKNSTRSLQLKEKSVDLVCKGISKEDSRG
jgi:hypothetical protein